MKLKYIGYAYPSSITATAQGFAKTGCWYVSTGEPGDFGRYDKVQSAHVNKEDAVIAAEMITLEYATYSQHGE